MPDGVLIAVVGPSGAGKDSLIAYARERLAFEPSILFVRRIVTRTPDAAEDHASLTPSDFATAEAAGAFAVCWEAHGLRYGIPAATLHHVRSGGTAIVNGSRAALPEIRTVFARVLTVHVSARLEILAARLATRGRESRSDIAQRLQRAGIDLPGDEATVHVDNSGALETAGKLMVDVIERAAALHHASASC